MAPEQPELPEIEGLAEAIQNVRMPQPEQVPQAWRPACASCFNEHKLSIMRVSQKLIKAGVVPGSQEFAQAMQQAAQLGQMLMQNPMMLQGLNGAKPDIIPAVRPTDVMVAGTGLCGVCFQPQEQQPGAGLIIPQMQTFNRRPQ